MFIYEKEMACFFSQAKLGGDLYQMAKTEVKNCAFKTE